MQHRIVDRSDLQLDAPGVHVLGQGDGLPVQARRAHVDPHLVVADALGQKHPGAGGDGHLLELGRLGEQPGHAAGGVATGVHLAAVGVPDAHDAIGCQLLGRRLDGDQLVAADAALAVGDGAHLRFRRRERRRTRLDHDEVVAEPVHLEKRPSHGAHIVELGPLGRPLPPR